MWETVKEHAEDGMDIHNLRDEAEAVYVPRLARFVRNIDVGRYAED